MPTGYTADLEDLDWDLKTWLKERVVRGLGLCVRLRDDGVMSQTEIARALSREREEERVLSSKAEVEEAEKLLAAAKRKTMKQWLTEWKKCGRQNTRDKKKFLAVRRPRWRKYQEAVAKLHAIKPADEVSCGAIRFALQQLELVRDEFSIDDGDMAWRFKTPDSPGAMRDTMIDACERGVKYAQEQYDEAKKAAAQPRYAAYDNFVKEVDGWFGVKP